MTEEMGIETYLAAGGMLSNPANVPPRYRGELMKLMATFVDSELAGAAGFADVINKGPGIKERIAAAKIVLEKTDHADKVLRIMEEFGANADLYASYHPWADRLPRDTAPDSKRSEHDMRLSVFNYPLTNWTDAVVMNLCMGLAVGVQLEDLAKMSYQPMAEALRQIIPGENNHTSLAEEGVQRLVAMGKTDEITESLTYWRPRVEAIFGDVSTERMEQLRKLGLRRMTGTEMKSEWTSRMEDAIARLGLN